MKEEEMLSCGCVVSRYGKSSWVEKITGAFEYTHEFAINVYLHNTTNWKWVQTSKRGCVKNIYVTYVSGWLMYVYICDLWHSENSQLSSSFPESQLNI